MLSRGQRGFFARGNHKRQFAYEAHTACDKHIYVLETVVTPNNIHDSVAFDDVYDKVMEKLPKVETVVADSATKLHTFVKKHLMITDFSAQHTKGP